MYNEYILGNWGLVPAWYEENVPVASIMSIRSDLKAYCKECIKVKVARKPKKPVKKRDAAPDPETGYRLVPTFTYGTPDPAVYELKNGNWIKKPCQISNMS